jgi:F0F1-type ATP synthase membrane subunit b/b'
LDIEWLKSNVFPYINLLIFLFLLTKFGKKPFQQMLQERRNQFVKMRDDAAKLYNEAKAANDQLEARYAGLKKELEDIKQETMKAAQWEGEQAIARAQQVAQTILSDAQMQIETMAKEAAGKVRERLINEVSQSAIAALQRQAKDNPAFSSRMVDQNIRQAELRLGEISK